jgi:hypothetical protein
VKDGGSTLITNTNGWLAIASASIVCALTWVVVVPGTITGPTFGFGAAALLILVAIASRFLGHAGPERLVSEVRYDAEHPSDVRR